MWAAKHCSWLFSSGQNRLFIFCCVVREQIIKSAVLVYFDGKTSGQNIGQTVNNTNQTVNNTNQTVVLFLPHPVYVRAIACVAAGQFLEGEEKDRLPGFLMFFNTAPFLKLLRQPIRREIINTLLNSIKLN